MVSARLWQLEFFKELYELGFNKSYFYNRPKLRATARASYLDSLAVFFFKQNRPLNHLEFSWIFNLVKTTFLFGEYDTPTACVKPRFGLDLE